MIVSFYSPPDFLSSVFIKKEKTNKVIARLCNNRQAIYRLKKQFENSLIFAGAKKG
jgi:hypothetical protein